jgi:hypothetical protein
VAKTENKRSECGLIKWTRRRIVWVRVPVAKIANIRIHRVMPIDDRLRKSSWNLELRPTGLLLLNLLNGCDPRPTIAKCADHYSPGFKWEGATRQVNHAC